MSQRLPIGCAVLAWTVLLVAQNPSVETAWRLVSKGQRTEAVALLQRLIKTHPLDVDARLLLGSLLMEAGERDESIAQLREAARLRPKSAEAHNALGEAYSAFGDSKSARPEFERAIAINPGLAVGHVNLGAALLEEGQTKLAAEHLDRAIKLLRPGPEAAYPHYLRAKIYSDASDSAKATFELEKAVALRPDFAEAWSDLGEIKKAQGKNAEALAAFQKAVEFSPDDAVAQTRFGSALFDAGNAHDAISRLREAARLDPKNQTTLNALLLALRKDGKLEAASAVRKQLVEVMQDRDRNDQNLVAALELNNRGTELEKKGHLGDAVEKYKAALELSPDHVGIRTNLAVTLLKLGRWEEGIAQMREALRRDPANPLLKKALEDALAGRGGHFSGEPPR